MYKRIVLVIFLIMLVLPTGSIQAQSQDLPVYIVQNGDTINIIALRFGISSKDLIDANQLANPDILVVGTTLKIPGLEGVTGEISPHPAPLGANLARLSRQTQLPVETLIMLNRITSPNEIYAGSNLIIPAGNSQLTLAETAPLANGQSMLEYAAANDNDPWVISGINQQSNPSGLIPNDPVYLPSSDALTHYWGSPLIQEIQVSPLPLVQGKTITIRVKTTEAVNISGNLADRQLNFFAAGENEYVALQGIHALAEPGLASFKLSITLPDSPPFTLEQSLLLESGYYSNEPALTVDPQTIDPAVTKPEDDLIRSIITASTPQKYWSGIFQLPVDEPACIKSWYGNRRSYNGGPYIYFHTGVDYGVCANLNIYAPEAGVVVYTGALTVRGNATIIDHGWGVYSGIWHQQSINVKVGDVVTKGQLIGQIGGTGRVTGPHLHWEVWVNGVQVEPLDWLDTEFPAK